MNHQMQNVIVNQGMATIGCREGLGGYMLSRNRGRVGVGWGHDYWVISGDDRAGARSAKLQKERSSSTQQLTKGV